MPLEDLGVIPHDLHKMTKDDVFNGNIDLINHAASGLEVTCIQDIPSC
jgi:hypothetical protein